MTHIRTYRATPDDIQPLDLTAATLDETTLQLPHGGYTVLPVYAGRRVVRLAAHFARLDRTAEMLGVGNQFSHAALRDMLRECLAGTGLDNARIRLTLPVTEPGVAYVMLETWQPPPETLYATGVRVATTSQLRRDNPRAKSTGFIAPRSQLMRTLPEGIYEIVLVGADGALLEGAGSNFYAVREGVFYTRLDEVLQGVARGIVLDACARQPALPLKHDPVMLADLPTLDEAMLSSASRGVVPVVEIDGQAVGAGKPGPVFAEVWRRYQAIVEEELETL